MIDSEDNNSAEYQNVKLTDLEELELKRRLHVAIGVLPRAIELFERRKRCQAQVEAATPKGSKEIWLLLAIIVLISAHAIMGKDNLWASPPGAFSVILLVWYVAIQYARYAANRDEAKVQDSLMALSVTFYGAAADWSEYWSIDEFSDVSSAGRHGFDAQDERIRKWLFRIRLSIVQSICDLDDMDRTRAICLKLCRDYGYDEDQYYWNT